MSPPFQGGITNVRILVGFHHISGGKNVKNTNLTNPRVFSIYITAMKTTKKDIADTEYIRWIAELAQRYRSSQIKAAVKVNDEMLRFYWSVGEDIEKRQYENRYGSHFYENVSKDLRGILNLNRGMSATTIKYTCYFYRLYSQLFENRQGVIDDFKTPILQQDAEVFQFIFNVPWSHHMCIINHQSPDGNLRI